MENQELIAQAIIVGGALLALYGIWKLIRKGFLFWVMLVVVGLAAVGVGLYGKHYGSMEQLVTDIKEIDSGMISRMTTENLEKLCENLDKLPKADN